MTHGHICRKYNPCRKQRGSGGWIDAHRWVLSKQARRCCWPHLRGLRPAKEHLRAWAEAMRGIPAGPSPPKRGTRANRGRRRRPRTETVTPDGMPVDALERGPSHQRHELALMRWRPHDRKPWTSRGSGGRQTCDGAARSLWPSGLWNAARKMRKVARAPSPSSGKTRLASMSSQYCNPAGHRRLVGASNSAFLPV